MRSKPLNFNLGAAEVHRARIEGIERSAGEYLGVPEAELRG